MMERIHAAVYRLLIRYRCLAMRGQLADILPNIEQLRSSEFAAGRTLEALAVAMLHAELLHLNEQDEESTGLFEFVIMPGLVGLPRDHRRLQPRRRRFRPPPSAC
jgi:hypothetical protein